ncbi:thioredoxin [Mahella sp.]|jgi:thioredoxin 1|uniref:thioredoxin n=1 Tax=Mahella sp. TaxID=2798721 RepID=UPI0024AAC4ED|nr:thioredoxin [Mahella sp.]MBZ4666283.1 thioredoxin [Mahella sp.]MDI3508531.1 thioredoxin 1 [Clostridiales bacterium]MDK2903109.1 thioredoxin 1 [Clostridiales bacterium]
MTDDNVITVTANNFDDEVLKSDKPVLIDFWAAWCGPCRMVSPIIEELAADYAGKIKVGKVNVDEQRSIAERYRIMSIPTVYLFKDGQPVDKIIGARPKADFERFIQQAL